MWLVACIKAYPELSNAKFWCFVAHIGSYAVLQSAKEVSTTAFWSMPKSAMLACTSSQARKEVAIYNTNQATTQKCKICNLPKQGNETRAHCIVFMLGLDYASEGRGSHFLLGFSYCCASPCLFQLLATFRLLAFWLSKIQTAPISQSPEAHYSGLLAFGFQELFGFWKVQKLRSKSNQEAKQTGLHATNHTLKEDWVQNKQ